MAGFQTEQNEEREANKVFITLLPDSGGLRLRHHDLPAKTDWSLKLGAKMTPPSLFSSGYFVTE